VSFHFSLGREGELQLSKGKGGGGFVWRAKKKGRFQNARKTGPSPTTRGGGRHVEKNCPGKKRKRDPSLNLRAFSCSCKGNKEKTSREGGRKCSIFFLFKPQRRGKGGKATLLTCPRGAEYWRQYMQGRGEQKPEENNRKGEKKILPTPENGPVKSKKRRESGRV